MTGIERWENPAEPIDETTAEREANAALDRVETAEQGVQRTRDAVSALRSLANDVREMHERNHYVDRLVPILRGTPRHA